MPFPARMRPNNSFEPRPLRCVVCVRSRSGFAANDMIEVYQTEAEQPPGEHPHGYDIRFAPYDAD